MHKEFADVYVFRSLKSIFAFICFFSMSCYVSFHVTHILLFVLSPKMTVRHLSDAIFKRLTILRLINPIKWHASNAVNNWSKPIWKLLQRFVQSFSVNTMFYIKYACLRDETIFFNCTTFVWYRSIFVTQAVSFCFLLSDRCANDEISWTNSIDEYLDHNRKTIRYVYLAIDHELVCLRSMNCY